MHAALFGHRVHFHRTQFQDKDQNAAINLIISSVKQPAQYEGADLFDSVSSYAGPATPPIRSLGEFSSAVQSSGKAGAPVALRRVLPMPVLLLKTFYARRQDMTVAKQGNMMQGIERGMKMVEIRATLVEIELLRKLLKATRKLLSPQWVDSCEAGWPEGWTASVVIPQPDSGEKVCPVCGQLAKNKC